MTTPSSPSSDTTQLDIKQILQLLPHRYPFLLVDKVLHIDPEAKTILAQKNISFNEAFFQGHFPGLPVMPGVLLLEALAQTGGIYLSHLKLIQPGKVMVLLTMREVKFRHPVRPGDVLLLHNELLHISNRAGKVKAIARVGEKVVAEAEITFALADPEQL